MSAQIRSLILARTVTAETASVPSARASSSARSMIAVAIDNSCTVDSRVAVACTQAAGHPVDPKLTPEARPLPDEQRQGHGTGQSGLRHEQLPSRRCALCAVCSLHLHSGSLSFLIPAGCSA